MSQELAPEESPPTPIEAQDEGASSQQMRCPSCEHERAPLQAKTLSWVCESCGALVDAQTHEVTSRSALSPQELSPFEVGQAYHLSSPGPNSEYILSAELSLKNEEGAQWVELFFVQPESGEERWLVIDEGEHYLFTELPQEQVKLSELPLHDAEMSELMVARWRGVDFKRDELGVAEIVSARGELFTELRIGERIDYWQGYDPDDEDSLSGELFGDGEVSWSYGVWRERSDLMNWNRGRALKGAQASQQGGASIISHIQIPGIDNTLLPLRFQLFFAALTCWIFMPGPYGDLQEIYELPTPQYLSQDGQIEGATPPFSQPRGRLMTELLLPEALGDVNIHLELIKLNSQERSSLMSPHAPHEQTFSAAREGLTSETMLEAGEYQIRFTGESLTIKESLANASEPANPAQANPAQAIASITTPALVSITYMELSSGYVSLFVTVLFFLAFFPSGHLRKIFAPFLRPEELSS